MIRPVQFLRRFSTSTRLPSEIEVSTVGSHVAHVKLNRPDRRNAYTMDLWKETKKVFDELSLDPKVRAIVLSGNGKSFCAGIDLQQGLTGLLQIVQSDELDIGRKARYTENFLKMAQAGYSAIDVCTKPVICASHSHCVGAGLSLIASCDIRFAAEDSVFSLREVDIGIAADVGALQILPKAVASESWLRDITYTARTFGVDEALQFGLISRIFPSRKACVEGALEMAETIASKSPIAVQGSKKMLNYARDHPVDKSLEMAGWWNMSQLLASDVLDSAMAQMNKKKATYKDV